MFKRILKILGICIATFVVVCGAGVGIYALQGGFKEKDINILRLYMDDATKAEKTIYTLNDFSTKINFEPLDATNTELEVVIQDPLRQVDNAGNLIKEGILKNVPKTIKAGQDFKIEINKDENSNNIGGVVNLTFKPKGNDKAITDFTLKVIVDVAIPDNSLYFAGNNSDTYSTTSGKTITMGISNTEQDIYLKSNLVNAFFLQANNKNLKQANISYVYNNLEDELVEEKSFADLNYDRVYNEETKEYNYFYKVPITPSQSGKITITAKMHRTHEIEEAYIAGDFDNIQQPTSTNPGAQEKLDKYNEFLNKYIQFFDTNEFSYAFFRNYLTNDGLVKLPYSAVASSREFIFQTCTSTINISAVNLKDITSLDDPQTFKVFTETRLTLNDMINRFGLKISLDHENVAQIGKEEANLFSTLQVSPYIYIEKSEYLETKDTTWQNYGIVLGVTGFDSNGKPQVSDKVVTVENVDSEEWIGFLVLLSEKISYKDYITSSLENDAQNKVWTLGFNVPLLENNTEISIANVSKALFLQFQVTGRDLNTNKSITKNAYTRIYIDYVDYSYEDPDNSKIMFNGELKRMSINTNIQNPSNSDYVSTLNTQSIRVSTDNITNSQSVSYKNIMYFAEKNSNSIDDRGPKLATIGSYKFRYLNAGANGASSNVKLFDSDEDLVGERLLNNGTALNPDYYLRAINASGEPVRIFAVVYLSDVDGNPIDVYGRPIVIDESQTGVDPTTLVVVAITDITSSGMASVQIDNLVDNINYYTQSKLGISIEDTQEIDGEEVTTTFTISEGTFVKRNKIDTYEGFSQEKVNELNNILKVKFLYRNRLTLYATNFEWDSTGNPTTDVTDETLTLKVKDLNGKFQDVSYSINTNENKQLALNAMVKDFNSNFYLNVNSTNLSAVQDFQIVYDEANSQVIGIKFEIVVEGKRVSDDDYIYIKPFDGVANALSGNNDYVSWEVNKLEVQDVILDKDLDTYKKLDAIYSNKSYFSSKTLNFGEVTYSNDSLNFTTYYIYNFSEPSKESKVLHGSIDDNVKFDIVTNLYNNDILDVNLIDMSQYAYYDENDSIQTDTNNNIFKDISEYINYYTNNTNTMNIKYSNPKGVAQLQDDLYFPSDGKYICVGSKKYEINSGNIIAGGRKYPVTTSTKEGYFKNEEVVIIKSGEYFPMVDYKVNETVTKSAVIICDETFIIDTNVGVENANGVIYNISESNGNQRQVKINTSAKVNGEIYSPDAYIDDGSKDNTKTALVKDVIQDLDDNKTYVNNAKVKFLKGGTLKDGDGKEIFVKDPNGKYYKDTTDGTFKIAGDSVTANERYSKKGITAYLMISYYFNALNELRPITKVIAYELNQEPVTLVATGAPQVDNPNGFVIGKKEDDNSADKKIVINAGDTTTFSLTNASNPSFKSNDYSIGIVGATYETSFFTHCKFIIDETSSAGIKFEISEGVYTNSITITNENKIKIFVPDKYANANTAITIEYTDENGVINQKYLRLDIKPNYTFTTQKNIGSETDGQVKRYTISLDSKTYNLSEIIANCFEVSATKTSASPSIELVQNNNENYIKIDKGNLIIGKSYALLNSGGNSYTKDYADFTIKITDVDDKGQPKEIVIDNPLRIYINPEYTLDLNGLTNASVIYGQSIFSSNYIKIYNGLSKKEEDLVSEANYKNILSLYMGDKIESGETNKCDNGIVTSGRMYSNESVKFVIAYKEGIESLGYNTVSHNVTLNVVGFEKYFSQAEDIDISVYPTADKLENYKNKYKFPDPDSVSGKVQIQFELNEGESLGMDKHFAVFTINNEFETIHIYAVLTTDGTNCYQTLSTENITGTSEQFKLAFATMNNDGTFNVLAIDEKVEITINVTTV